jgi:alpha-galactosidase
MNLRHAFLSLLIPLAFAGFAVADEMPLSDAGIDMIQQEFGKPHVDASVDNHPLTIAGSNYATGVGTHAASIWRINTNGHAEHFKAAVGMDDEVKDSPDVAKFGIDFKVIGDGKTLFDSKPMHSGDPAVAVDIDIKGVKMLLLEVNPTADAITFCHADWVDATITYTGEKPVAVGAPDEPKEVLTPKSAPTPRINSAKVVGVRPGHPLLFTIAATGDRPMTFSAEGLPAGISLDAKTGQLSGSVATAGESIVKVKATNALGSAEGTLKIVVGSKIALTPPMGWNSWNAGGAVSEFANGLRQQRSAIIAGRFIDPFGGWAFNGCGSLIQFGHVRLQGGDRLLRLRGIGGDGLARFGSQESHVEQLPQLAIPLHG